MNSFKEPKKCKFGLNCKYGQFCRYGHPQMQINKQQFHEDYQIPCENIHNLNNYLLQMNVGTQQNYKTPYNSNQNINLKETKNRFQKDYQSSDSNSQGSSQSDQQPEKFSKKINPDEKHQQILSLKTQDKIMKKQKKISHFLFGKKTFDPVVYQLYDQALFQFFQKRHIKPQKRQKIIVYLAKQMPFHIETVGYLVYFIQELEGQGFVQHFCYKRLIKTICKQNFVMENVKIKLSKKINVDNKKKVKIYEFNTRFPNPVEVEFLESMDLIETQSERKGTIYLIDGNNCLTTQKHLRHHFKKQDVFSKAQAQVRFRWLMSLAIQDPERCFVFFDDKFGDEIYEKIYDELLTGKQYKDMILSSTVIYAQKDQQADECIRGKIKQLKENNQVKNDGLILITGDRILVQQCYQINPLRRSSGSYLIKFIRKIVKLRQKQNPQLKKRLKKILSY